MPPPTASPPAMIEPVPGSSVIEAAVSALGAGLLRHPANGRLRALPVADWYPELVRLTFRLVVDELAGGRAGGAAPLWEGLGCVEGLPIDARATEDARAFVGGWCRKILAEDGLNAALRAVGALYEALLDRAPELDGGGEYTLGPAKPGHLRRTSGSYYTPERLVEALVDAALEPVVARVGGDLSAAEGRREPGRADAVALLAIRVVDPTCGTGHFLLAAARRLAGNVVSSDAIGVVLRTCVYGVDLNPGAVELCRATLWLAAGCGETAAYVAHIRRGDALLGAPPGAVAAGIPAEAWEPAAGEDRAVCRALKERCRREGRFSPSPPGGEGGASAPDEGRSSPSPPGGEGGASAPDEGRSSLSKPTFRADTWCAAFVWPRDPALVAAAPTPAVWAALAEHPETLAVVERLASHHQFFHWHLAFPEVFARGGFDVVLGNPPYLNQLESDTAVGRGAARLLGAVFGAVKQPYTDLATLFLVASLRILRPGGRLALVHPLSFFAAKDAGPARRELATTGIVRSVWITTEHIFPGAAVIVGATCVERGDVRAGQVTRSSGNTFAPASPLVVDMERLATEPTWGGLIADLLGVPFMELNGPVLTTIADTTADFRDQFYGVIPAVVEDGPDTPDATHPPLVITGLVDPAVCLWGARPCTFGKRRWERPRVAIASLEPSLQAWARGRMRPKLVVATQSRVIEAFADPEGRVLNTVPTITVTPHDPEDLWRLLAVLLAPPVSAWALGRYAGTALTISAIKLSAEQLGQVPLPIERGAWDTAAALVARASASTERDVLLYAAAAHMCDAYGVPREPVLGWWSARYRGPALAVEAPAPPRGGTPGPPVE